MDEYERMIIRSQQEWQRLKRSGKRWGCPICGNDATEIHHIGKREFGDEGCAPLCTVCHMPITERHLTEHPKGRTGAVNPLERHGHHLLGMSDLLESMSGVLRGMGESYIAAALRGRHEL